MSYAVQNDEVYDRIKRLNHLLESSNTLTIALEKECRDIRAWALEKGFCKNMQEFEEWFALYFFRLCLEEQNLSVKKQNQRRKVVTQFLTGFIVVVSAAAVVALIQAFIMRGLF